MGEPVEHADTTEIQRLALRLIVIWKVIGIMYFYFLFCNGCGRKTLEMRDECHVPWPHGWAHAQGTGKPRPRRGGTKN
jgi:hypothetical protein